MRNQTSGKKQIEVLKKYFGNFFGIVGLIGVGIIFFLAIFAPLLANGRPLVMIAESGITFPALRTFFAPDSPEFFIEKFFNYLLLLCLILPWLFIFKLKAKRRLIIAACLAIVLAIPFLCIQRRLERINYHGIEAKTWSTIIPYSPFENIAIPYEKPSEKHWLGTDQVGRDVASRLIYGTRVSLAVGLGSTIISLLIGTIVGLAAGYFRGKFDLLTMRIVEIIMCFPTFLLLLILMSIMKDYRFEQSILIVTAVIGLTGWIGVAFLVRGETLKQSALPYIQSCHVAGISSWRTMIVHLLPNIIGPILISFTFGVAGGILAESGLSFLGFGVQQPTASWGGLLREAFDDPMSYWHLTLFPGIALFVAISSFNIVGEVCRRAIFGK